MHVHIDSDALISRSKTSVIQIRRDHYYLLASQLQIKAVLKRISDSLFDTSMISYNFLKNSVFF